MEAKKYLQFPKVIAVHAIEKYKIFLKYDDGTEGIVDLSDAAGKGVFNYWDINDNFFKVYIDRETDGVAWSSQLDICPDAQYLNLKNLSFEEWKKLNLSHASSM